MSIALSAASKSRFDASNSATLCWMLPRSRTKSALSLPMSAGRSAVGLHVHLLVEQAHAPRAAGPRRAPCAPGSHAARSGDAQPCERRASATDMAMQSRCAASRAASRRGHRIALVTYAFCCQRISLVSAVDDLHEDEVLHAPRVLGALVGRADLAGDEVLHAQSACRTGGCGAGSKTGCCAPSTCRIISACRSLADDAARCRVDEPRLGLAQHRVELRVDVLARLVDERRDGDRLPIALSGLRAPLVHDRRDAQLVEQSLQGALDVVLVEPRAHRRTVDARIVRAADVLTTSARGRGEQNGRGGEQTGSAVSEKMRKAIENKSALIIDASGQVGGYAGSACLR